MRWDEKNEAKLFSSRELLFETVRKTFQNHFLHLYQLRSGPKKKQEKFRLEQKNWTMSIPFLLKLDDDDYAHDTDDEADVEDHDWLGQQTDTVIHTYTPR